MDVGGVDHHRALATLGGIEGKLIEHALEHRVQAARADVFAARVHLRSDLRERAYRVLGEGQLDALGRHQGDVLLGQRVLRLGQDANEIVASQRSQLDADGKASLKLRDQIGRLGGVKRARGNEQDVVGTNRAVFGVYGRAFDNREQVALHAFARDVGTPACLPSRDFVYLIDEHDARLLGAMNRVGRDRLHVHQARGFFLGQEFQRLGNLDLTASGLLGHDLVHELLRIEAHFLHALGREYLDHRSGGRGNLDFDLPVVEMALAEQLAKLLAGFLLRIFFDRLHAAFRRDAGRPANLGRGRKQDIEQPFLSVLARFDRDPLAGLLAYHLHGDFGEIANHRFHVAADIADLRITGCFHLDERGLRQARQPACNLGLTNTGRTDHQDVLGRDFVAQLGCDVLPPPAVSERDRDGALGIALTDNVTVELGDNLARGHYLWNVHRNLHVISTPFARS